MLIIIGGFFTSITLINELINHNRLSFTKAELILYPALIVAGYILRKIPDKKCVIGIKYSLEIIGAEKYQIRILTLNEALIYNFYLVV